jgi:hypothetical protein
MNGKGDRRRPCSVSRRQFEENWEAAFGKRAANRSHTAHGPHEQPAAVCACGKTSAGICPRCAQDMSPLAIAIRAIGESLVRASCPDP